MTAAPAESGRTRGRVILLLTSPRVAPGLLSRDAWHALNSSEVLAPRATPLTEALADDGVAVVIGPLPGQSPREQARGLIDRTAGGDVVWCLDPVAGANAMNGDALTDPLTDALAAEVSGSADAPEIEVLVGSYDVPGARLLDVVAVMDRLRSPGGCPWDAEQTPQSLVRYLLEEAHEAAEAIEAGDPDEIREELGDLLLQVAFQSRMAQDDPEHPFDIDDVAGGLVDKLVRRHPHVFADGAAQTPAEVERAWEQIKAEEKPERKHALDGIPAALPALMRAEKAASRLTRLGQEAVLTQAASGDDLGARLLALVLAAQANGEDPEAALRATLRVVEDNLNGSSG